MILIKGILVFSLAIFKCCAAVTSYGSCDTPLADNGECIPLRECGHISWLATNPNSTQLQRFYVEQSQCGYLRGEVLICCPKRFQVLPIRIASRFGEPFQTTQNAREILGKLPMPPDECGENLGVRIIGGEETGRLEYPWLVLLEYKKLDNTRGHSCGGSLINNRYVLTAAHCVPQPTSNLISVRLGEWDTTMNPDCIPINGKLDCAEPYLDVPIGEAIVHPDYVRESLQQYNDIALLRLAAEVQYRSNIKPICLPVQRDQRGKSFDGVLMEVAGWGYTESGMRSNRKKKAELKGHGHNECRIRYIEKQIRVQNTQLCAGGEKDIDSCGGDSGGPLMFFDVSNQMERYYLAGIVSLGPQECGKEGWPGIYTRVDLFMDWIIENIFD